MFDKLVESAKQKQGGRARRLFLATCVVYGVALTAFGVMTIVGFSPALAENDVLLKLIPPPMLLGPDPKPAQIKPNLKLALDPGFIPPKEIKPIPTREDLSKLDLTLRRPSLVVVGDPGVTGIGRGGDPFGAPIQNEAPPPPPTPTPVPKPAATPPQDQVVRLTSVLTQGRVLKRIQPPYPAIARQAKVQGSVQVQIDISETGDVSDVTLLSGHPLLRDAALQAARHWLFRPTELNGRPVRAIGVITFNFKLD